MGAGRPACHKCNPATRAAREGLQQCSHSSYLQVHCLKVQQCPGFETLEGTRDCREVEQQPASRASGRHLTALMHRRDILRRPVTQQLQVFPVSLQTQDEVAVVHAEAGAMAQLQ